MPTVSYIALDAVLAYPAREIAVSVHYDELGGQWWPMVQQPFDPRTMPELMVAAMRQDPSFRRLTRYRQLQPVPKAKQAAHEDDAPP